MIGTFKNILNRHTTANKKIVVILGIFLGSLVAILTILEPLIFTQIIKNIEAFYITGDFQGDVVRNLIIFWVSFALLTMLLQYTHRYFLIYKPIMNTYIFSTKYFIEKVTSMGYDEYLSKQQGSLYKVLNRGTDSEENLLFFFFSDVLRHLVGITGIICVLIYTDVRMAILALSMIPFMVGIGFLFVKRLAKIQKGLNDDWDDVFGKLGNILSGFMLTKILVLEGKFLKSISNTLFNLTLKQDKLSIGWSFVNIYTGILVMISRILVLGFGIYYVIDGSLSFASLFLVFSYIGWIYFPLGFIFDRMENIVEQFTSVEKMENEFELIKKEKLTLGKSLLSCQGKINFENVSFEYIKGKKVLNGVNFNIKSGEKVAFVGNTGAGKSTLINLIFRLWDVKTGEILLDGENINNISKASLRKNIGLVAQDNSLFNMSIKENLLFAKSQATKKELESALKKAKCDFVFDLENGINTVIGERGLKLSGGEKQRLNIARLFLKDPKILILDEATSALDNKTEKQIQKSLDELMKGRTSIIIAHRLSTIQNADRIYMLEDGKIAESGRYDELMKKEDKFYNLANPEHLILN